MQPLHSNFSYALSYHFCWELLLFLRTISDQLSFGPPCSSMLVFNTCGYPSLVAMEEYIHTSLDVEKTEIRLLSFDLSRSSAQTHKMVTCQLESVELAKSPPFVALSYAWGDCAPFPANEISIHGWPFFVHDNLFGDLQSFGEFKTRGSTNSQSLLVWFDDYLLKSWSPHLRSLAQLKTPSANLEAGSSASMLCVSTRKTKTNVAIR